jgi:hypothetical protein
MWLQTPSELSFSKLLYLYEKLRSEGHANERAKIWPIGSMAVVGAEVERSLELV